MRARQQQQLRGAVQARELHITHKYQQRLRDICSRHRHEQRQARDRYQQALADLQRKVRSESLQHKKMCHAWQKAHRKERIMAERERVAHYQKQLRGMEAYYRNQWVARESHYRSAVRELQTSNQYYLNKLIY